MERSLPLSCRNPTHWTVSKVTSGAIPADSSSDAHEYSDPGLDDPDDPSVASATDFRSTADERNRFSARKLSKYAAEIFTTAMNDDFSASLSSALFLTTQRQLTPRAREVAVKWMVQAQSRLRITSDSLYNAVTYFDIACCSRAISRPVLQLLVITCLWISTKVEEGRTTVQELLDLSSDPFTRAEVLECELDLVQVLGFRTSFPTRQFFLRRILDAVGADGAVADASTFACEVSLLPLEMLDFRVQVAAAASVCVGLAGRGLPCAPAAVARSVGIRAPDGLEPCFCLLLAKVREVLRGGGVLLERHPSASQLRLDGAAFPPRGLI
jgi:hypothetical protein